MALRAAVAKSVAPNSLKAALLTTSRFPFNFPSPPTPAEKPPPAEPSTNLFVSGLSKRTTTEGLRTAFEKFGEVVDARVVTDRNSGYSKGFGFVKYSTLEGAAAGIEGMDAKKLPTQRIASSISHRNPLPLLPTSIYELTGFDNPNSVFANPASRCSIRPEFNKNGALEIYPSFSFEHLLNPFSQSGSCLSQPPMKLQNLESDESRTMWADSVKKKRKKKMNKHKLRKLRKRDRGRN